MLGVVASVLAVVYKRMRQLPTTRNKMQQGVQSDATCNICWELLANYVPSVFMGLHLVVNYASNHVELVIYWWLSLGPEPKPEFKGDERTFRLWLDTNQYQQDMAETVHGSEASWILTNCGVPPKLISQKLRLLKINILRKEYYHY